MSYCIHTLLAVLKSVPFHQQLNLHQTTQSLILPLCNFKCLNITSERVNTWLFLNLDLFHQISVLQMLMPSQVRKT